MPYIGASLHIFIALFFAVHVVRTGREMYWLMILFMFPLLGSVVYFFAIYLPSSRLPGGTRKLAAAAMKSLDPGRELREAQQAFDMTPSAQNQMRLAAALLAAGQAHAAAVQYEACLTGPFANEPEILMGAAQARLEDGHSQAALDLLVRLRQAKPDFRKENIGLLFARAYSAQKLTMQARAELMSVVEQFGSVEARVELAIWALENNEQATAENQISQIKQMQKHWNKHNHQLHKDLMKRLHTAVGQKT